MTLDPRRRWTAWTRWPDREQGPYHVGLTWSAEGEQRAELVGFELWARPPAIERVNQGPDSDPLDLVLPPPTLTARLLHDFPLASVARATRDHAITTLAGEAAMSAAEGLKPSRRSRYSMEHYRDVATLYSGAVRYGRPIYESIQLEMPASKSTVAHWIGRCRALGLL